MKNLHIITLTALFYSLLVVGCVKDPDMAKIHAEIEDLKEKKQRVRGKKPPSWRP